MHRLVVSSISAEADSEAARQLRAILEREADWQVRWVADASEFPAILRRHPPALIIALLPRNGGGGVLEALLALLSSVRLSVPIVPMLAEGTSPEHFSHLTQFADFLLAPFRPEEVRTRLQRVLERTRVENMAVTCAQVTARTGLDAIVGEEQALIAIKAKLPAIARAEATALISGETGTGKEMIARAIHYLSHRAHAPFLPVNCGAIPTELFENELFGHKPGAFTDARTAAPGMIAEAEGGTLFLDEVDTIPLLAQVKLLRFLQQKTYRSLGGAAFQQADVRIIAATNVDLEAKVEGGAFREDLYYRLNIIPITLPPLRERRGDIPLLARHLLGKYVRPEERGAWQFSSESLELLQGYPWPGNVRELENLIQQIVAIRSPGVIGPETLPSRFRPELLEPPAATFREAKARVVAGFEREYASRLLTAYNWNITRAAQAAEKDRRAFARLIKKHGIERPPASMREASRGRVN